MVNDELHVVHARAAGLDVHKQHITATVRLCGQNSGEPTCKTRSFGALAPGLTELVAWLTAFNPGVAGSIPARPTNRINKLRRSRVRGTSACQHLSRDLTPSDSTSAPRSPACAACRDPDYSWRP